MTAIGRAEIERLIPHAGEMCLLDEILGWDARQLICLSRCGTGPNPLRRPDGTLGMASGIELAGQAMAAHGSLCAGAGPPRPGMLVALREVSLAAGPLDAPELRIEVERLLGDEQGASYRFIVTAAGRSLLAGRASVRFG